MLKVEIKYYDDLTDEEKLEQPNNGSGKEYASYLKVSHNGEVLGLASDAMEPEDCTFGRDLSWIEGIINKSYEAGKSDSPQLTTVSEEEGK